MSNTVLEGLVCYFQNSLVVVALFTFKLLTLMSLINVKTCLLILIFFHPPRTFPSFTFIDFSDFFHPPLLVYCSYVLVFFQKIPPSTFIPTSSFINSGTFAALLRSFQPPRLLQGHRTRFETFQTNNLS